MRECFAVSLFDCGDMYVLPSHGRSSVQSSTLSPVWNETWMVKTVPSTATLSVVVRHAESGSLVDNDIGEFHTIMTPGSKEVEIVGKHFARNRGTFWLNVRFPTF